MGRVTEYFEYLTTPPSELQHTKFLISSLRLTEELQEKRAELKLYKDDKGRSQ